MHNKSSKIDTLLYFLKGCKRYFALAILFVFVQVIFDLINPKIMGYTVDYIVGNTNNIPKFIIARIQMLGGKSYIMNHLYIVGFIVVAIGICSAVSRYLFRLMNQMSGEALARRMRNVLFDHIVRLPFSWHDYNKTGDIIQRCTSDVDVIRNFVADQLVNLFRMIAMIILSLYFMCRVNVILTVCAVAFLLFVIMYSMIFHGRIGAQFEKVDNEEGRLSAIAQENLAGVRVVRAFGREMYERRRFEEKNEIYINHWVDMMKILAKFWTISDFVKGLQIVTILSIGSYFATTGRISAGQFVAFLSYNILILQPMVELGRVISDMSKSGVSIDRLKYILDSSEEEDDASCIDFPENGDIVFNNVSFSYDKKEVLRDVNMTIRRGQTVGILGGTGSGKSTLMLLLDNLYDLSAGNITINGVDIRNIKRSKLRRNIGFVLQEPYLFSRSIEDNIRIARDNVEHSDVMEAVERAALTSSIDKFADGLDTYVGEKGVTLSGGQKQRTAIAQMLIGKPPIMIFDDSLSAVDANTDAAIRASINNISDDTTVIIISHRITTIMKADNIYVLSDGQVVEEGNHESLINKSGIYKNIFDMQKAEDV